MILYATLPVTFNTPLILPLGIRAVLLVHIGDTPETEILDSAALLLQGLEVPPNNTGVTEMNFGVTHPWRKSKEPRPAIWMTNGRIIELQGSETEIYSKFLLHSQVSLLAITGDCDERAVLVIWENGAEHIKIDQSLRYELMGRLEIRYSEHFYQGFDERKIPKQDHDVTDRAKAVGIEILCELTPKESKRLLTTLAEFQRLPRSAE